MATLLFPLFSKDSAINAPAAATAQVSEHRAWLSTPPGRGAVAVVCVTGPQARALVQRRFVSASGADLSTAAADRLLFGRWQPEVPASQAGSEDFATEPVAGEEIVVCPRRGAGDAGGLVEWVEVHCHGGRQASAAILNALETDGCRIVAWGQVAAERAADRLLAEAAATLPHAPTLRTANVLLDQLHGALSSAVVAVREEVQQERWSAAADRLTALLSFAPLGARLIQPWRVAIVGRPNVGKSSLLNALAGSQRAIVYDQPGTTRDVVTLVTAINGWPVELADTAGIREADDALEAAGVARAVAAAHEADLVLLVLDAAAGDQPEDCRLLAEHPDALVVRNKSDLLPSAAGAAEDSWGIETPAALRVSALSGRGLPELLGAIGRRLVPEPPEAGAAVPFTSRQLEALSRLNDALAARDSASACSLIDMLLRK